MHNSSERRHKLVLRGLPANLSTDELTTELKQHGLNVHHVSEMKRPLYTAEGQKHLSSLQLYVIELDHAQIGMAKTITVAANCVVQWEEHRGADRIPHCRRCQMWGHSHNGCRRNILCLFCGGGHAFEACPSTEGQQPSCANCGGPHTANYGGCEELINYKAVRATRLTGARQAPTAAESARRANAFASRYLCSFVKRT